MGKAVLIFCAILAFLFMATKKRSDGGSDASSHSENIIQGSFEQAVQNKETVLVDFWAPWCGPCKTMNPVLANIADDYSGEVAVYKVNVDDAPALAQKYNIRSIPAFLIFKNGKLVGQEVGVVPESRLTRHF
ncbi:thioredoxin [Cerasicoccus fimbriatus]|uniref:thioredoxin n=1 Tax=Cerasicoccus fimbriatus TaxID=3014554 RepID=UPI0022B3162A|nr:thioredoxin [Cerasicoccus sp. TK19100]